MKFKQTILWPFMQAVLMFWMTSLQAQDALRFEKEIDSLITLKNSSKNKDVILFTGSSSIRLWKDLASTFPDHNVLNLGFGGSEMGDLLYYTPKLLLPFRPIQIFIYEGDNDISKGRSEEQIISTADSVLKLIRRELPETQVVFISPKPSVARWHLKAKYESFNKVFKAWVGKQHNVLFADVWTPMVDANGNVTKDLFIEDNLHLNSKGYKIWTHALRKYLIKAQTSAS